MYVCMYKLYLYLLVEKTMFKSHVNLFSRIVITIQMLQRKSTRELKHGKGTNLQESDNMKSSIYHYLKMV